MMARRALLTGLGGTALAVAAWGAGAFRATMAGAETRIARRSSMIETRAESLEYAVAGHGPPLMMIHGTGGGFDQGLLFAHGLVEAGFQIVAPSRFGYLRSSFPEDASPAHQANVLLAVRIPGARLVVYPDGGHIWLGHDSDLTRDMRAFITGTSRP